MCEGVPFADFRTGEGGRPRGALETRELHRLRALRRGLPDGVCGTCGISARQGASGRLCGHAHTCSGRTADGCAALEPGALAAPVPQEMLDRIVAAADLAPTATNARQLGYTLVTDPVLLRRMSEYTLGVFGKLADRLSHPLVRPWLSRLLPDVYRYVPVFRKMRREYAGGNDRILRGATAVLLIHAPKESRFGAEDANLAYQNASLMAEALGVSQIYMGFVLTAVRQDRKKGLCKMLGLGGRRICAVMALGMPQFRYPNYIDRTPSPLERR